MTDAGAIHSAAKHRTDNKYRADLHTDAIINLSNSGPQGSCLTYLPLNSVGSSCRMHISS